MAAKASDIKDVKSSGPVLLQSSVQRPAASSQSRANEKGDDKKASSPSPSKALCLAPSAEGIPSDVLIAVIEAYSKSRGVDTELKHQLAVLKAGNADTVNSTPSTVLNKIFPGSGNNQRIGRFIRMHHLTVRGIIEWSANNLPIYNGSTPITGATAANNVRVVIVRDKMPLVTDVWDSGSTYPPQDGTSLMGMNASGAEYNTICTYNPVTHGYRFHVLMDKIIHQPTASISVSDFTPPGLISGLCSTKIHEVIDLDRVITTFYDDNNQGSILTNGLKGWVMAETPSVNGSDWCVNCRIEVDLAYVDT